MDDHVTRDKWDKAAEYFDLMNGLGPEKRWGPHKQNLFSKMKGNVLFLAMGTGLDIQFFPPDQHITGIDISPKMLEQAQLKAKAYPGTITLREMDVHEMDFADNSFDQVFTSCTFCSVPDPVNGLRAIHRVLKPGGELFMFEHTGSRYFPFNLMLNMMTFLTKNFGPQMNRNTDANVLAAGFQVTEIQLIYLDVVKMISAYKPA